MVLLPTTNFRVRADFSLCTVGRVKSILDGAGYGIENEAPYALAEDDGSGDHARWLPTLAQHVLKAIPYSECRVSMYSGKPRESL